MNQIGYSNKPSIENELELITTRLIRAVFWQFN